MIYNKNNNTARMSASANAASILSNFKHLNKVNLLKKDENDISSILDVKPTSLDEHTLARPLEVKPRVSVSIDSNEGKNSEGAPFYGIKVQKGRNATHIKFDLKNFNHVSY